MSFRPQYIRVFLDEKSYMSYDYDIYDWRVTNDKHFEIFHRESRIVVFRICDDKYRYVQIY